jgi:hypothetical protein
MKRFLQFCLPLLALLVMAGVAAACPTCKDQIAGDPAAQNMARGYAYSIVFMLSVPPLILTGLGTYFYLELRRAYAKQALEDAAAAINQPATSS